MSMSAASDRWNPPIPPDDNEPDAVDETELGKCGCIDWHMADCEVRDTRDYEKELSFNDYQDIYEEDMR